MARRKLDPLPPLEWFMERVCEVTPNGCWIWRSPVKLDSTGQLRAGAAAYMGKKEVAYRALYRLIKGEFDETLELDHLCRVPRCVNPDHLEPVTQAENKHRANQTKTQCKYGHPYTPENTILLKRAGGWTERNCRTCDRIRKRYGNEARKSQPMAFASDPAAPASDGSADRCRDGLHAAAGSDGAATGFLPGSPPPGWPPAR